MAMELLGPSLESLLTFCDRKFHLRTVLMFADQAVFDFSSPQIARLEWVHSCGYLHRDLKPDNFAIGVGHRSNVIYLLDYGLSKQYKDPITRQHIPYRDGKRLTGTIRYASVNAHLGIEQSRRDDLESLGYILVLFAQGGLPWQGLKGKDEAEKSAVTMKKKVCTPLFQLCQGLPSIASSL